METIFISGCGSGIGRSFLDHYRKQSGTKIIAVDMSPMDTTAVALGSSDVEFYQIDVTDQKSLQKLAASLEGAHIDILIHSAGVRGLVPFVQVTTPDDVAPAEAFEVMDLPTMLATFNTNTIGTFALLQALMPNLRHSSTSSTPSKVVIMGSRMGSMSSNTTGGGYAYRASKAGVNAIVKSLAIDFPDTIFTVLHPGRVETNLVECKEEGAIRAQECVCEILRMIPKLSADDSGKFYDRFRDPIGW